MPIAEDRLQDEAPFLACLLDGEAEPLAQHDPALGRQRDGERVQRAISRVAVRRGRVGDEGVGGLVAAARPASPPRLPVRPRLGRARGRGRASAQRCTAVGRRAARRQVREYVGLGTTGLKVSRLCLGAMTYGTPEWRPWVLDEAASRPFIRQAWDAGIKFFDTADMYTDGASA